MRLIDADAYKDSIRKEKRWIVKRDGYINEGFSYDQVMFAIDKAPTIGAVNAVCGSWEYQDRPWGDRWQCSVCQHENPWAKVYSFNYCPNCGAKMDEVHDGTD